MGFFDKFIQHVNDKQMANGSNIEQAKQNQDGSITLHIQHGKEKVEHTLTPQESRNLLRRWEQNPK